MNALPFWIILPFYLLTAACAEPTPPREASSSVASTPPVIDSSGARVVFHSFHKSASDPVLDRWNVAPDTSTDQFIRETVDEQGRVTELVFRWGRDLSEFTCFYPAIIRYTYAESKITETSLYAPGVPMDFFACDSAYEVEVALDSSGYIIACKSRYDTEYDPKVLSPEERASFEARLRELADREPDDCDSLFGYIYSSAKNGGRNVVSRSYTPGGHFPYSDEAASSPYAFERSVRF